MKSIRIFLLSLSVLLTLGFVAFSVWVQQQVREPLPVFGTIPDFSLIDSEENTMKRQDLEGKIWLADFIFTTCSGPCPIMSEKMASLYRSFILEDGVDFVSVSVNPEYDSPEVLKDYAARYDARPDRWHFLTGDRDVIHSLAVEGCKLGSIEDPVFHSTYFVLIDRGARIRGYYDGTDQKAVEQLYKDMAFLIRSNQEGSLP